MAQFSIIKYLGSLSSYMFDNSVYERIAVERGVSDITSYDELEQKQKDLLLADLLFTIYISPSTSSSISKSHGSFSQSIGSQSFGSKEHVYDMMIALYRKWNDEKLDVAESLDGSNLEWLDY